MCPREFFQSRKREQSRGYRHRHNSTLISEDTRGGNIFPAPNARASQRARRASGNNSRWGIIVTCATRNCYRERGERSPTSRRLRTYAVSRDVPTLGCIPEEYAAGLRQPPGQAFRHIAIPDNEWTERTIASFDILITLCERRWYH